MCVAGILESSYYCNRNGLKLREREWEGKQKDFLERKRNEGKIKRKEKYMCAGGRKKESKEERKIVSRNATAKEKRGRRVER